MTSQTNSHPFSRKRNLRDFAQSCFCMGLRTMTYFVLLSALVIFARIAIKGTPILISSEAPFINTEFLLNSPETLHVFEYEGQTLELSDSEFREFQAENATDIRSRTFAYAAGGIFPAIVGTILLVTGSMLIGMTMGILSAIYLSEYSKPGPVINAIRLSILNLSGVPSIVFGLFGFGLFVVGLQWNVSLLSGWFTLAFMVLPIIIISAEEALRAVPNSFREGSYSLGAGNWYTIRKIVLPQALPGIFTSSILGVARVAGETAPIMFTAAYAIRDTLPWQVPNFMDFFFQGVMALPYHIYLVSAKIPQNEYTERVQYGSALVLLAVVFAITLISILLRSRLRRNSLL